VVTALFGAGGAAHAQCTRCTNVGSGSLASVTFAVNDSAFGDNALHADTTGGDNTAIGSAALEDNTTGGANTATGSEALFNNLTGVADTASGAAALLDNTTGNENTAMGEEALADNTTGDENTATGFVALLGNLAGIENTATGVAALRQNTSGSNNIAEGFDAGDNLTTGSNNIDIGNEGVAAESNSIRVGVQGTQTATFVAGIFGTPLSKSSASPVLIDSSGHLGVQVSSARYKRDIRDMGDASEGLLKLRPVSFRYIEDPDGRRQYGLIAEQVERVYPELVIYGDDGKVRGVRYDLLPALLVKQAQEQAKEIGTLTAQAGRKDAQIAELRKQVDAIKKKDVESDALAERMNALEREARRSRPERVAAVAR
jgi:hypothetical protein